MFRDTDKFIVAVDVEVTRSFVGERRMKFLPQIAAVLWPVSYSVQYSRLHTTLFNNVLA